MHCPSRGFSGSWRRNCWKCRPKSRWSLFAKDEERIRDVTAPEELIQGLKFDKFNEKILCKVIRGIFLKDFATVIENLAARFNIPDNLKSSLLEGLISDDNVELIKEFKFTKGIQEVISHLEEL